MITCEGEDDAPNATLPSAHPVSVSEEDDMDEDYREILSPGQPLPLPFQFQELLGPYHMPSDSPLIASISSSQVLSLPLWLQNPTYMHNK
jgi:hypothetical protein